MKNIALEHALANNSLPYDKRVQWLESTGMQYIDTGISATHDNVLFDIAFSCSSTSSSMTVLGTYYTTTAVGYNKIIEVFVVPSNGELRLSYGIADATSFSSYDRCTATDIDCTKMTRVQCTQDGFYVNGAKRLDFRPRQPWLGLSMYMFGANVHRDGSHVGLERGFCGRVYECTLSQGQTSKHFIPVAKDGIGYMYDTASKVLYGNQGQGEFIIGPEAE